MPTYRIRTPDGAEFEVTAPEGVTEQQALERIKSQYKAAPQDPYAKLSTEQLKAEYRKAQAAGEREAMPRIADAYVKREQQESGTAGDIGGALNDVVRQTARGVPILGGALDEINAGLSYATGQSPTYEEALDYERALDRSAEQRAPLTTGALNVAGGVASGVGAVRGLGMGVGSATPVLQRAAAGVAIGAPVGAADFFARGEGGADKRTFDAGIGAGAGGIFGAAAPYVGAGLSAGSRRVMDVLTSEQELARLGISPGAARLLIRQLTDDGADIGQGAARIREAGPDAMVADAGESTTNLLDTALQRSGPGATAARRAINERAERAGTRLDAASDRTFGQVESVQAREQALRAGSQQARGNAYDTAYSSDIDYNTNAGQRIATLWRRVRPNRRAEANALLEEAGLPPIEDGALPTVRQIDFVTRSLNNVAESAEGQGALGGINAVGHSAQTLSQGLRNALREAVSEYGQALDIAADPIRQVQAARFGRTLLDDSVSRDDVAREVAGMTRPERSQALRSVRVALDDAAARVRRIASDANIDIRELRAQMDKLTSRLAREKLGALLGNDRRVAAYYRNVDRAMRALELRASVARNSRTFGRQSMDEAAKAEVEPGVIRSLLQGSPALAAKKLVQRVTGVDPRQQMEALDRLYGEVANALTTRRGRDAEQFLTQLRRAINAQMQNRAPSVAVGRIGQSAFAGAPAATVNSYLPNSP